MAIDFNAAIFTFLGIFCTFLLFLSSFQKFLAVFRHFEEIWKWKMADSRWLPFGNHDIIETWYNVISPRDVKQNIYFPTLYILSLVVVRARYPNDSREQKNTLKSDYFLNLTLSPSQTWHPSSKHEKLQSFSFEPKNARVK